jgi:Acetyltransferase (GNAT) domain
MFRYEHSESRFLRLFEESDAEELHRVIAANRAHLAEWLPWVEATSDTADARLEFIRGTRRQIVENDGFQAAIVDGNEIIGAVGFHGVDWNHRATGIGYLAQRGSAGARDHDGRCQGAYHACVRRLGPQSRQDSRCGRQPAQQGDPSSSRISRGRRAAAG